MQEGAVFNVPPDSPGLVANDSPIYGAVEHDREPVSMPIREGLAHSSSNQVSTENHVPDGVGPGDAAAQPQKRQPRRLTKSRGNSESRVEKPGMDKQSSDRAKGVLTKKASQQNARNAVDGEIQDGGPATQNPSTS
ncbi:Hybrid signal transduction histidine kinase K [Tolypocladium paradoxum]|uniref:Hybrid signal transduction histidine kinase K n=1 Tax=Tolypocladium paradoxum TaxID=94208 RepID=A0A2S4L6B5_9HYPO|nr:Hybrid signal transduction histidine kinase K [Tolypocladium paradoxum]